MNSVCVTGRLVRDPESILTDSGVTITTITVAIKRDYKNKETNEYESDFVRFKAFNKPFIQEYIHKGDMVGIQDANIKTGSYEKDGEKVYTQDFIINKIEKISSPQKKEIV